MTPRADEYDDLSATDDEDEGLKEDMAALSRACMITATSTTHHCDNVQPDPLLDAGDAIIPVTANSAVDDDGEDDGESDLEYLKRVESLYRPLSSLPPLQPPPPTTTIDSDDDEDDLETLRAIRKRFSSFDDGPHEGNLGTLAEGNRASSLGYQEDIANCSTSDRLDAGELSLVSQDDSRDTDSLARYIEMELSVFVESCKPDDCTLSKLPQKRSTFPPSAHALMDAIKKNRRMQSFLRNKLIEIEAKIEENKQLRHNVKVIKDFQVNCSRRTGSALSLKKDPRVQLISTRKCATSNNAKRCHKKKSAMCYGPAENSGVNNYKTVLERFPLSLYRKKWSNAERENLKKGIKQQFQEMLLQISADRMSSEAFFEDENDMDSIIASVNDLEITPERIREFLPKVDWDKLASMYDVGHSGAECESRWLNCEDPLIKHGEWTNEEDRSLLVIIQNMGMRNWFNIAVSLGTNRTPFQCLARYQRSLNASMLNSDWTDEEDAQLCAAVAIFGEHDWQSVASVLERRTGTQCSNRWQKSLCPERKGSFTLEEDERLTVAVMLFGRKWNEIAKFVPGRTQSQCRDRYLNSLDPSLKWGGWTKEEDSRLKAAISKHGFCWSKVAEEVPPRTDSQCRKRWKVLFPEQVPLLQEARKRQKLTLASNFVDRESERPAITFDDFLPLCMFVPPADVDVKPRKQKRKQKSSNSPRKMRSKSRARKAQTSPNEVEDIVLTDEVKACDEDDVNMEKITEPCLEDNPVPTDDQEDLAGHNSREKFHYLNPRRKGCTESNLENNNCILPCKYPASQTTNGHYTEDNGGNHMTNRGKTRQHNCGRKLYAKESFENSSSQGSSRVPEIITDGEVKGSRAVSKKERKTNAKRSRHIRGAELSKNKQKTKMSKHGSLSACVDGMESQDGDNITLACFLNNKSDKRRLTSMKNVSQASVSDRTAVVSESPLGREQVENQIPSVVQDGLFQACGSDGRTKDLLLEQSVASPGKLRKPKDVNMLIDDDNRTLACLLGNKSNNLSQGAKGYRDSTSSRLEKGSVLLHEVHCAKKPTITAYDNGLSMSMLVEGQTVLAESRNINVEEDERLVNFIQNKKRGKRKRTPIS